MIEDEPMTINSEVELYIEEIDSDDDSLENHLKKLVRKSKTN